MNKIELLSPAGSFECLKAAVQSGADCVYFGSSLYSARASAENFDDEQLKEAIEYAKIRNVKTNLALNTLIKDDEFSDCINQARKAYEYGIDAIIVQDLGLAKKLIELFPDLPIHASTQMTVHNLEGVLEAEKLGFKRVVLSRELSISEIKHICENSNIEIEVFVHGALCICYSGQCLMSSMIGARSGNRGKCAQPCRLPYELISEDSINKADSKLDKGYLLSTRDLCSLEMLPNLVRLGITSFKIEGRLKSPEYVATVTKIYRKYIDLALSGDEYVISDEDKMQLLQVFNRGGFSTGYLNDVPNSNLIYKNKPNNIGIPLGKVHNFNSSKGYITLKLENSISIGDSVSVGKEKGSYTVSELMIQNKNVTTAKAGDIVKIGRIKGKISVQDNVYRMNLKSMKSELENLLNSENAKVNINCKLEIHKGIPVTMSLYTNKELNKSNEIYENIDFTITSDLMPEASITNPITKERIISQINKLGGTPYQFKDIIINLDEDLYIPSISKLNQLRRDCLSELERIVNDRIHRSINLPMFNDIENAESVQTSSSEKKVSVLLNVINKQYNYLNLFGVDRVYIPMHYFYSDKYENKIKEISTISSIYIYMPSVLKNIKSFSEKLDDVLKKFDVKGFVISNISNLNCLNDEICSKYEIVANYTMNIYNKDTISELEKLKVARYVVSPELNKSELNSLCGGKYSNAEVIVFAHLPVMTTNYCLLSKSNFCLEKCKGNCSFESGKYYLKDRLENKFRILPNYKYKTTTIFNSKILSYACDELNTGSIRLDFLDENIDEINKTVECFKRGERFEGKEFTNGNYSRLLV